MSARCESTMNGHRCRRSVAHRVASNVWTSEDVHRDGWRFWTDAGADPKPVDSQEPKP